MGRLASISLSVRLGYCGMYDSISFRKVAFRACARVLLMTQNLARKQRIPTKVGSQKVLCRYLFLACFPASSQRSVRVLAVKKLCRPSSVNFQCVRAFWIRPASPSRFPAQLRSLSKRLSWVLGPAISSRYRLSARRNGRTLCRISLRLAVPPNDLRVSRIGR
jgi:hypothetical protein